jgi:hypothetical protein
MGFIEAKREANTSPSESRDVGRKYACAHFTAMTSEMVSECRRAEADQNRLHVDKIAQKIGILALVFAQIASFTKVSVRRSIIFLKPCQEFGTISASAPPSGRMPAVGEKRRVGFS